MKSEKSESESEAVFGPLIFFILRYIEGYTHKYLYIDIKMSRQISCGLKNLDKLGVRIKKLKHPLGRIFLKSV